MDVQDLRGAFNGPVTKHQLLSSMTNRDLILSNQYDDNDVLTMLGKCTVINRRPPSSEDKTPMPLPPRIWVSRYSISFGDTPGTSFLTAYDGENQPWPDGDSKPAAITTSSTAEAPDAVMEDAEQQERPAKRYRSDDDEETDETEDTASEGARERPLSEGPNNKGKIVVGADHQAKVSPFSEGHQVVSRNPQLVWTAGTNVDMDKYLTAAAEILGEYLEQNHLFTEDPYFPLPHEQMEELLKESELTTMTLSNLSTGSSMTTKRNKLTRECKLDALIAKLHDVNYDVDDALEEIKASPQDYVISWTRQEREMFNSGFRRYSGSLRMITSRSLMSKNFKDVVDYHYRFKIPDQFRRYQDSKRVHAVRMMEIIENRRTEETTIPQRDESRRSRANSDVPSSKPTDWYVILNNFVHTVLMRIQNFRFVSCTNMLPVVASFLCRTKTSISDVVGVVEYRRTSAKDLLLDIQQAVGTAKLGQICKAIKTLHHRSVGELKGRVEDILQNHPSLLDRFMEYLPKKFRV